MPSYDLNWVDITSKKGALKLEKLDADLKSAKSFGVNLVILLNNKISG